MAHRGPDDSGYQIVADGAACVALGQTRLSVIDLTSGGHQPMLSDDGDLALVFNGEIYNYRALRQELRARGRTFRSESDTEVLLAAWSEWGSSCLPRLDGMFSLVVHDRKRHRLSCARDAFGIKPFFYQQDSRGLLFASEQQALLALRDRPNLPDVQRAYDYLVHADYDSQERSFIRDVRHLLPGTLLELDLRGAMPSQPTEWWRPPTNRVFSGRFTDAVEAVREEFLHSVRLQLRSDVPLGATLSGGIDSSAVVCAMRHIEPSATIHTFSYVAAGAEASEESWVDVVNAAVNAVPHKLTTTTDELLRDLDTVIATQGEPFGSTSIYAQYRVFEMARASGMTVTLDGQGADELLAGYNGFPGRRLHSLFEARRLRSMLRFARDWASWPGREYRQAWMHFGEAVTPEPLYATALAAVGHRARPRWLKLDALHDADVMVRAPRRPASPEFHGRRLTEHLANRLHRRGLTQLLRHGDRNAMAFSIESRVPFLTISMAELVLSLPEEYLLSDRGETKHVFRAAMRDIVPDRVLDRRDKIGFQTPEREWILKGVDSVRRRIRAAAEIDFLDADPMLRSLDGIASGKPFNPQLVWRWLNYVTWYQMQMGQPIAALTAATTLS